MNKLLTAVATVGMFALTGYAYAEGPTVLDDAALDQTVAGAMLGGLGTAPVNVGDGILVGLSVAASNESAWSALGNDGYENTDGGLLAAPVLYTQSGG